MTKAWPTFDKKIVVTGEVTLPAITNQVGWFLTVGRIVTGNRVNTSEHIGFAFDGGTLYASNANGTNQTLTDIGGWTAAEYYRYYIGFEPGTRVLFYVDGGLKATHTTNLPTGESDRVLIYSIKNTAAENKAIELFTDAMVAWEVA